MGHKTHPLGFRLGIIQEDRSLWYSGTNSYISFLKEDYTIREYISKFLISNNVGYSGITKLIIKRNETKKRIYIEIQSVVPGRIVGKSGSLLRTLDQELSALLKNKKVLINIVEITKPYTEASILVDVLVKKLEERVSFRKCIREILRRYRTEDELKGIKVQIAGRLNGAEIARTEWVREGRVPLQTLRANIDYSYKVAQTTYGILGIKIWLFKNEIVAKKNI
uniref:Small ribosomal subunit protein uS3c n=6 Tax=Laminariaceae TaxID=33636 RepID=A0A8K1ST33_9PHAE|nr:30S ribosomal protein S3 [Saccharina japonica]YP_010863407.1 30S ribosomal protein S3 [Saccharina japonica x Saccharina latissima]YP_011006708.1 30S ribosomal protein S3 [Hedophyllum nigripes]QOV02287.1 30S ribosomal protein S3 [Saccharina sp. ye-B]QWK43005.1 ribosomal protein S3 [Saccharina subsessilis]QWK43998.1 ribosomal protein S3 [Arthrothamnus bifidus]UBI41457.1 30S ribosomal protein S3 [Saccharina sp.]UFQ24825.1 30S ribosomal protein S3 [Saccharina sp. Rongfu]WAX38171.1 ribosomal 